MNWATLSCGFGSPYRFDGEDPCRPTVLLDDEALFAELEKARKFNNYIDVLVYRVSDGTVLEPTHEMDISKWRTITSGVRMWHAAHVME